MDYVELKCVRCGADIIDNPKAGRDGLVRHCSSCLKFYRQFVRNSKGGRDEKNS